MASAGLPTGVHGRLPSEGPAPDPAGLPDHLGRAAGTLRATDRARPGPARRAITLASSGCAARHDQRRSSPFRREPVADSPSEVLDFSAPMTSGKIEYFGWAISHRLI